MIEPSGRITPIQIVAYDLVAWLVFLMAGDTMDIRNKIYIVRFVDGLADDRLAHFGGKHASACAARAPNCCQQ